ncbi:MAG: type IV secretory system conjugative DNA transfer family protein, partial [Gemmatimonadota bacterium]|nr:type IV secretory system conjugative DNA transfer family protein [Gemmatimonadota bacterium]
REDEGLAVRDINVLLDALLTPPRAGGPENSRHFYESARAIIAGYIAWVRFREPRELQTLGMVYRMLSMGPEAREEFADLVRRTERFAGGLAHIAVERQAQVGKEEGGSNFSTIANQLSFLNYPELLASTSETSFNPLMLADGDTDLFVVVPEDTVEHVKGWLRLWVAIPNAVANIRPLERDMLIVIDEMPRLGYLKPVMDGYTMAAGKGVHFWCFAQSISALDSTWGKEHRKTLLDLAEVVQILGFPRTDAEGAEAMSKAIGTATFEGRTESRSGTVADSRVAGNTQWQAGESFSLVRERLVTPDELMTLAPDRQYVIGAAKDIKRDALYLHHAHYWERPDTSYLADPNPLVLRKQRAAANAAAGNRSSRPMAAAGGML